MKALFIYPTKSIRSVSRPLTLRQTQFGISYISAMLKKHGHQTDLIVLSEYFGNRNESIIEDAIERFVPDIVLFTAVATEYKFIARMAKFVKERHPSLFRIVGGTHVSLNPHDATGGEFDAICVGEGEYPTLELINALGHGQRPSGIPNIWLIQNGVVEQNETRPFLEDLDSLPFPDRSIWDRWMNPEIEGPAILLGRGCPFLCAYCCNHALKRLAKGNYVRLRSHENIISEVKELVSSTQIFGDIILEIEAITIDKAWALGLCEALRSFNKTLAKPPSFSANVRITPDTDLEALFAAMKEANFSAVNIGLESGSERVRKESLRRNYSNADVIRSVQSAKRHGLKVSFFNMIGIPGETKEDFMETVAMNRLCMPDWHSTSIFYPYPGTDLYKMCVEKKLISGTLAGCRERAKTVLDLPGFSRKEIERAYVLFGYHVYKGKAPFYKILIRCIIAKIDTMPRLYIWYRRLTVFRPLAWIGKILKR